MKIRMRIRTTKHDIDIMITGRAGTIAISRLSRCPLHPPRRHHPLRLDLHYLHHLLQPTEANISRSLAHQANCFNA